MPSVNLTKRVSLEGQLRFLPVVMGADGIPRKDGVYVPDGTNEDGTKKLVAERHPEGNYYIEWTVNGKRHRQSVGKNHELAWMARNRKQAELGAIAQGITVVPDEDKGETLAGASRAYLETLRIRKRKPKTVAAYKLSVDYLVNSATKEYVSDLTRDDLLAFKNYLLDEEELAPRTVSNHLKNVAIFLKDAGRSTLLKKGDYPEVVQEEVETYEPDQLAQLFAACTPEERLLFRFFLLSGFREQEVMYTEWRDIFPTSVKVTHKPKRGWTPKAYREREVPVPTAFIKELLDSRPAEAKANDLVFPSPSHTDKTNGHMLRTLKQVVRRAGINCGYCDSCIARNECEHWWLHKFRATFATTVLQAGVDLKTVQNWLGHKDMASTQRYVKAARGAAVQAKVESIWKYSA